MTDYSSVLKNEERAVFELRSLYSKYGYLPYKMSKFEEYDLYVRNKDFLVSDSVITFNDTNGKLLALKPDVTLSIVKNTTYEKGVTQKLFYNENVYRVSGSTHAYKEIMQTGLECIGDADIYDISEVLMLSLESLEKIGGEFVLDVSHMGVVSALLDEISDDDVFKRKLMHCLGEKNRHEVYNICREYEVGEEAAKTVSDFIGIYGKPWDVLKKLEALVLPTKAQAAVAELAQLWDMIAGAKFADRVNFDFSIVNDMNYYNGIVFTGFIEGIPESVLSGGQYDKLLKKMGKKGKAIGFAVYLDLLEQLRQSRNDCDVDVLVLYDEKTDPVKLSKKVKDIIESGRKASAQRAVPEKLSFSETVDLTEGGASND